MIPLCLSLINPGTCKQTKLSSWCVEDGRFMVKRKVGKKPRSKAKIEKKKEREKGDDVAGQKGSSDEVQEGPKAMSNNLEEAESANESGAEMHGRERRDIFEDFEDEMVFPAVLNPLYHEGNLAFSPHITSASENSAAQNLHSYLQRLCMEKAIIVTNT